MHILYLTWFQRFPFPHWLTLRIRIPHNQLFRTTWGYSQTAWFCNKSFLLKPAVLMSDWQEEPTCFLGFTQLHRSQSQLHTPFSSRFLCNYSHSPQFHLKISGIHIKKNNQFKCLLISVRAFDYSYQWLWSFLNHLNLYSISILCIILQLVHILW